MTRKPIPKKTEKKVMYDSQYVCSVCQDSGCQIHHIDKDNSNNNEENLILLCTKHHDEAHTKRDMSKNLTANALLDSKEKWVNEVRIKREKKSTVGGQLEIASNSEFAQMAITWGYINHSRVIQLAKIDELDHAEKEYFEYCKQRGIVDQKGVLIKPNGIVLSSNYINNTIYDWYNHGDDQRLHLLYTACVDQVSKLVQPIHLETGAWEEESIQELINPGDFIFFEDEFYFETVDETQENQHRRVLITKGDITIEFYVDTIDMFGTTSITVSFSENKVCSALLQLKSFEKNDSGQLVLHCTPIALGVAFNKPW